MTDPDQGWVIRTFFHRPYRSGTSRAPRPPNQWTARAERDGTRVDVRSITEAHALSVLRARLGLTPARLLARVG